MTRLRFITLLLLLAAAGARADDNWKPEGWEHLDVEPGVFAQYYPESSDVDLSRLLLPDPYRAVQLLVKPSLDDPEWAVYIVPEAKGGRVLSRRLQMGFAAAKKKFFGEPFDPRARTPAERAKAARAVKDLVVSTSAPLSAATFARLQRLWALALADARVQPPREGKDGVRYHFAQWESVIGYRSGTTWSPREKTACAALVAVGEQLAVFVALPAEKRAAAERALVAVADAAAAQFAPADGAPGQ